MESTVPVTMVPCTVSQVPMCLTHRKCRLLKAPWSLMITWTFMSFAESRYF